MRLRRFRIWVLRPLLIGLELSSPLLLWAFLGWDNYGTVRPGEFYRSAQTSSSTLATRLRQNQIKTVLNLRGSHPESEWYLQERAATLDAGATQVDMPLSSCEWMSRTQARALLQVLETAERPVLIHCQHGSERTGLTSAFVELLREGSTLDDAKAQFSYRHLYLDRGDGVVMYWHVLAYESWLVDHTWAHTPDRFRHWINAEYQPGQPCREQWLYDPYPLVVVTRGVKRMADRR